MVCESAMYLYPWQIDDFQSFKREYEETGCNSIAPALHYHHGNTLNARTGRFHTIKDAAASFMPKAALYGKVRPAVHQPCADAGTVPAIREWCSATGRSFSGWTVLLHNSTLGMQYPELTVENMYGDRYVHALCPANPDVKAYAGALLQDICTQLQPDSLIVESATMQPPQHGTHHEIANIHMSIALRWLYSLCFCPHCMAAAATRMPGLDPAVARGQAQQLASKLANWETAMQGDDDAQLLMLLLENPVLYQYQQVRQQIDAVFIGGISTLLHNNKVEFRLIPSAVPFAVNRVFMEGMSFTQTQGRTDMLVPLVYGAEESYPLVKANIRLLDNDTPVGLATSLLPSLHPNQASLADTVAGAKAAGCSSYYFYNFTMASAQRLSWMQDINRLLEIL